MQLRTELHLPPSDWRMRHTDPLIALGSCFAAEMGERLSRYHFPIHVNPFGITYHPLPLLAAVDLLLADPGDALARGRLDESLFEREGVWGSFYFHSQMSRGSRTEFLDHFEETAADFRRAFREARYLLLTFGTSLAFQHGELGFPVANCHRFPQGDFERRQYGPEAMAGAFRESHARWRSLNPDLRVLLTVSPIRHIRSGLVENGASKAALRVLCDLLAGELEAVRYFPSYEIMLDDLRDYRFYERDLVHPSGLATDYIWDRFGEVFFDPQTQETFRRLEQIHRDLAHRPRQPGTAGHVRFLDVLEGKIKALEADLDLSVEREALLRLRKK